MFQKPAFGANTTGFGMQSTFGSSPSTIASPFGGFKPAAATSAFGAPSGFGAGASTQPATGGGLFGTTNTTGGLFGATAAPAPTTGFGASGSGFGFGANTSSTGLFNTSNAGALFPQTQTNTAFGAKPQGFGFGGTPASANTGGGLFNTQQAGGSLFGQNNTMSGGGLFSTNTGGFGQQQQQATGTGHVKYNPLVGTDMVVKSGTSQSINIKHHCITCMKEYEGKSLEELRLEDYTAGRKGAAGGVFGFQQQDNKPVFGASNAFGQPATTSAPGVFGGSTLGTGGFGQTNTFSFGGNTQANTNTTCLFGAQKPAFGAANTTGTGLFGAPASTQASTFGTNTSTFGFGSNLQNQSTGGLFGAKPATTGFGAAPASTGFGSFGSGGLFGAKPLQTQAPTFGAPQPGVGSMAGGFGTATSSAGGLFGGNNAFGKPATSAPSFGFGNTQPTLGGMNTGLGANSFAAKPATQPSFNMGGTSFSMQPNTNFRTGMDGGLGGGIFGNNSSLGGSSLGLGMNANNSSFVNQEKKNYTTDLPESSDSQSINSIVIPQRKLFTQKENLPQKKFAEIISTRKILPKLDKSSDNESINSIMIPQRELFIHKENLPQKKLPEKISTRQSLAKPNTTTADMKTNAGTRELFQNKPRSKPIFPAALLDISPNKTTADKTEDFTVVEPKVQVRNIFGYRATKKKKIFTNFIIFGNEDEIPEIQPKVFAFQKKIETRRRGSSSSHGIREPSPTSSMTTDIEMEDWKMLPSSTMVENQLEIMMSDGHTPKKARLSKFTEDKESETGTGSSVTKQSVSSKDNDKSRKSKTFTKQTVFKVEKTSTRNKSHISQVDDEVDQITNDKSRKSKTFTKEIVSELEKSHSSQGDNEIHQITNDKSRKSKTFTKEMVPKVDGSKITDFDISQSSIKTRSQMIKLQNVNHKASKFTMLDEPTNTDYASNQDPALDESHQENDDEELNFTLEYENDEVNQPKEDNETSPGNKKISIRKTRSVEKVVEEDKMEIYDKYNKNGGIDREIGTDQTNDVQNRSDGHKKNETNEMKVDENVSLEQNALKNDIQGKKHNYEEMQDDKEADADCLEYIEKSKVQYEDTKSEQSQGNIEERNKKQQNKSDEEQEQDKVENYSENGDNEPNESRNQSEEVGNQSHEEHNDENEEENQQQNENQDVENEMEVEDQPNVREGNESGIQDLEDIEPNEEVGNLENNEVRDYDSDDEPNINNETENKEDVLDSDNDDELNVSQQDMNVEQNDQTENEEGSVVLDSDYDDEQNFSQEEINVEQNDQTDIEEDSDVVDLDNDDEPNISQNYVDNESDNLDVYSDNDSEPNSSQTDVDNESDNLDVYSDNDSEPNISQNYADNESDNLDVYSDNDSEPNSSQTDVDNESDNLDVYSDNDSEPNISQNYADNESDNLDVYSDNDSEPNSSQTDVDNESDNQDGNQAENAHVTQESEDVESAVSHDTTGKNIENDSPEVICKDNDDHIDSFTVRGRNTSVTKTEIVKNLNIRPSLSPVKNSANIIVKNLNIRPSLSPVKNSANIIGFSDSTKNSSAEGSGWDSHRTTRKTLRQTFGKDFTPRKSLRTLVMEKSAKRQMSINELTSVTAKSFQANSTELAEMSNRYADDNEIDQNEESNHEVSLKTRQTTLEMYLQNIKKKNMEDRLKIEEEVRNSLNAPPKAYAFKVPAKPMLPRRPAKTKPKKIKSTLFLDELPAEFIEDMKYKPPKRFQPRNAPWITKRLYKFLEAKLEPKYDYKARIRAEKLVEHIYQFAKDVRRRDAASPDAVAALKREFARLHILKTHFEFYEFIREFMPREVRVKVVPDVVNNIPLPSRGIFSDIHTMIALRRYISLVLFLNTTTEFNYVF